VAFDGKCFVASGAAIPVGRGPSVHAASPFWTEVLCPRARGQNNYIYDPFDDAGKVNAPDFACRLPAVFWKRNAAVRFDSPVHDTFRFKVRGCFLHEASFYSATAEQRTCAVGTDEAKAKTVGFKTKAEMAPTIEDAAEGEPTTLVEERLGMGVVTSTAADVDAVGSSARLILADLMVSAADGKSFFDVADFNKVARAKLQHSLSKSLGVAAMHVLIESVSQEGKKGMVTMAFLSNADGAMAMKLKLADAAVAVQEILGGDLTSKIEFANTRDMLEYAGAKTILSTSVTLLVGDGNTAEALTSSSALRVEFQRVIAETLGVAISAVRITGVESAAKSRRLNQAGRGLTEGGSAIILSFTVVTEPSADADLTTEGMTASLQGAINDGTFVKSLNAPTALDFQSAEMGKAASAIESSSNKAKKGSIDYEEWAIWSTILMCVALLFAVPCCTLGMCIWCRGENRGASKNVSGKAKSEMELVNLSGGESKMGMH